MQCRENGLLLFSWEIYFDNDDSSSSTFNSSNPILPDCISVSVKCSAQDFVG